MAQVAAERANPKIDVWYTDGRDQADQLRLRQIRQRSRAQAPAGEMGSHAAMPR
jgi:hypothetical protein